MLTRWLAPILSFTAEELWKYIPGEKSASVFLEEWYEINNTDAESDDRTSRWNTLISVRDEVNKQLELLRVDGAIGSSLDAEVDLYCDENIFQDLSYVEDELRFVLITSYAQLHTADERSPDAVESDIPGLFIQVKPSENDKCIRCWHHREDVGTDEKHPELCGRCIENVDAESETRQYA